MHVCNLICECQPRTRLAPVLLQRPAAQVHHAPGGGGAAAAAVGVRVAAACAHLWARQRLGTGAAHQQVRLGEAGDP